MSFGLVCVKIGWLLGAVAFSTAILWLLYRKDPDFAKCMWTEIWKENLFLGLANAVFLYGEIGEASLCTQACHAGMFSYLLIVSVMDLQLQMVNDFLHGIGIISGMILAFCKQSEPENWWSYLMFCIIQYFVFGRMYGMADVAVFLVCALFFTVLGGTMETYLLHMALTFLLLGVVQFLRGNIDKQGNLKVPVALIPYIAISFFVII